MPRASSLPEQLRYLQPFRKQFRSVEDLNEDTGFEPLIALFGKRIADLPSADAEKILEQDITLLQAWLTQPEQQNDPLHFATGVFLIASPADIVKEVKSLKEQPPKKVRQLVMELPVGAKRRRLKGLTDECILFVWNNLMVFVNCDLLPPQNGERKPDLAYQIRPEDSFSSAPFTLGQVSGKKYMTLGRNWYGRPMKRIEYLLQIPDGEVSVSIDFFPKKPRHDADAEAMRLFSQIDWSLWDEAPIEAQFHTIKIISQ